ncbi:FliG C-terminal domain-containing protein, partial [Oceanispirochaeta sp.]|uniref:FliG C-terminal domain-containing protein n=1 Tax=Oceanispirochaeta sp. TaxID=2035350 RepID=UPI00263686AE
MEGEKVQSSEILPRMHRKSEEHLLRGYDFSRPDKLSKEQIRTIAMIYENFARLSTTSLSAQLRQKVKMQLYCVDQMTFGEFISSLSNPTILGITQYKPLVCSSLMEVDPVLSSVLCDSLYGGTGKTEILKHELTQVSRQVMMSVMEGLLKNLKEAWKDVFDMTAELSPELEHNPEFVQIVPPSEMVILVSLDVIIAEQKGQLQFCIPYLTIEPIMNKLSARWYFNFKRKGAPEIKQKISALDLETVVLTRGTRLNLKSLGGLKKGNLIGLPDFSAGKGVLKMGGEPLMGLHFKKLKKKWSLTLPVNENSGQLALSKMGSSDASPDSLHTKISELSNLVSRTRGELSLRMDEIIRSQDHLNDQIFLGHPEDDKPTISENTSLDFIGLEDLSNLYLILENDFPQLTALLLSRMENEISADFLSRFSLDLQANLIVRISSINHIDPRILQIIIPELRQQLSGMCHSREPEREGIGLAASILSRSSRELEKSVLSELYLLDKELCEKLKTRMFVFEDIQWMKDESFALLLEKAAAADLALPLRVVDEAVKEKIRSRIPEAKSTEINELLESGSRIKIKDIDDAEARIINVIREMEEEGTL